MASHTSSLEQSKPALEHNGSAEVAEPDEHYRFMLKLLSEALVSAVPDTSPALLRLKSLALDVQQPLDPAKLAAHRAAIEECVPAMHQELARVRQAVRNGTGMLPADSATGLPGPASAQQLIASRLREGRQTFAAVLVLDQLRALNARFGRNVGDEILLQTAQDLEGKLSNPGILHRWRGPAFLVICNTPQHAAQLEERIRTLVLKRLERTINVESRSILVKLSFSYELHELTAEETAENAARIFDEFVASRGGVSRIR